MKTVKEYKRTCNVCGKVWHSLVSREKDLQVGRFGESMGQVGEACSCCGSSSRATMHKHTADSLGKTVDELRRCPECGSTNYKEEITEYEK